MLLELEDISEQLKGMEIDPLFILLEKYQVHNPIIPEKVPPFQGTVC